MVNDITVYNTSLPHILTTPELFLPTLSGVVDGFLSGGDDQESPIVKRQIDGLDVQGNIQSIATNVSIT